MLGHLGLATPASEPGSLEMSHEGLSFLDFYPHLWAPSMYRFSVVLILSATLWASCTPNGDDPAGYACGAVPLIEGALSRNANLCDEVCSLGGGSVAIDVTTIEYDGLGNANERTETLTLTEGDCAECQQAEACVLLGDQHVIGVQREWSLPSLEVATHDGCFDWSGLSEDLTCGSLEPEQDIASVDLIRFDLDSSELLARLQDFSLEQADLGGMISASPTGGTSACLGDFTFLGAPQPDFLEGEGSWVIHLSSTPDSIGSDTRMIALLEPEVDGAASVSVPSGCGVLAIDVQFDAEPFPVSGVGPWHLSWSEVQHGVSGGGFQPGVVDGAVLAGYHAASLEDLEQRFSGFDTSPDVSYQLDVDSTETRVSLAALVSGSGEHFAGFSEATTWVFALECSACLDPAPAIAVLLDPQ